MQLLTSMCSSSGNLPAALRLRLSRSRFTGRRRAPSLALINKNSANSMGRSKAEVPSALRSTMVRSDSRRRASRVVEFRAEGGPKLEANMKRSKRVDGRLLWQRDTAKAAIKYRQVAGRRSADLAIQIEFRHQRSTIDPVIGRGPKGADFSRAPVSMRANELHPHAARQHRRWAAA